MFWKGLICIAVVTGLAAVCTGRQNETAAGPPRESSEEDSNKLLLTLLPLFLGFGVFCVFLYCMSKRAYTRRTEDEIPIALKESPRKLAPADAIREVRPEGGHQQLVFFAEDHETFKLDDLLAASAYLQSQSSCTSFYKVLLKNNATYAVKRLKKLQAFIHQSFDNQESIPHGNLELSNILLSDNMEPLISEYGISSLLDPKQNSLFSSWLYSAGEKFIRTRQCFSFRVILLELLSGKTEEKTGVDLPRSVGTMCVLHSPQDRPTTAEVEQQIDKALLAHEDCSISSMSSLTSSHPDCCMLHSVIPETWDTPGSNY
ncbi:RNA-binding family protein isoform 1 [Hibiscus syriacus]|uniref:RNA-binding family protein isoform 1 n=1 Tax=Hibiscus syriacus TaxID=106335 RepID=A0A6A3D4W9_HIBSY|nr:RNA-binding family protein isoform 1 [Hibiscus syriacus]